jgi:excisionase family DNA binding protein
MDFLSTKDAADRLNVSLGYIYQLIRQGRLPATKFSGVWVIDPEDLKDVHIKPQGNYKLSQEEILQIKVLYEEGFDIAALARKFKVSERTIYRHI